MLASFFVAQGRAGRMAFWRAGAIIGIVFQIVGLALIFLIEGLALPQDLLPAALLLLLAVAFWASFVVGVRRLHDRDRSGWWMLLAIVPLVGTVWRLVANGCFAGSVGPNRYGTPTAGMQPIADVLSDDVAPLPRRAGPGLMGTLALWLGLVVMTAVTSPLFQDPNQHRSSNTRRPAIGSHPAP